MTGETVVDEAAFLEELDDIARTGVAREHEEAVLGESSLGAPVFEASGNVVGAVALVMPSSDWPGDPSLRDSLRETARNISRELGALGWPPIPPTDLPSSRSS